MAFLRFLTVSVISFLLLSPLIKKTSEIMEKPLILIASDNSQSIIAGKDSLFYKKEYSLLLDQMVKKLEKNYSVSFNSFGEKVSGEFPPSFNEKETDISDVFTQFLNRYSNRNIGAMILLSDGIFNKGSNPVYSAQKINFPLYTIALGDTLSYKDLILKKVIYNRTVFIGDKFPVEAEIQANQCNGERSTISVIKGDQVIEKRLIVFTGNKSFQKVTFFIDAKVKGIQHYTITIDPVESEFNKNNNKFEVFIDVLETRQKIAFLYQSPHPDITAIRQALEGTQKYDLIVRNINDFTDQPGIYDLIILYQLPSTSGINNITRFQSAKTSLLYILGSQTDLNTFNTLKTGMRFSSDKVSFSEALPSYNPEFSLFTTDKNFTTAITDYPPLLAPFGSYQYSPVSEVLFYQKLGNVTSKMPLIIFLQTVGQKTAIITGENIWKWRLSNFLTKGNHQVFDEMINKMVQYLTVKEDKSFFRIKCNDRFRENEMVEMEADVYNESYEMINQQDVNLTIIDEHNKSYPFIFGKTENAYFLNAGTFPVGKYTYNATVKSGKTTLQKSGSFIIAPINLEVINTVADHNLLFRLATLHGGDLYYPKDLNLLIDKINHREDIRPVIYTQKRFSDLTGNLLLFMLILTLLSTEWFLRKRAGRY